MVVWNTSRVQQRYRALRSTTAVGDVLPAMNSKTCEYQYESCVETVCGDW